MESFDVFVKITLDTSGYDQALDAASSKIQTFASKLKSGLSTAAKAGAAAVSAATTAVGLFAKSSIEAGMSFDAGISKVGAVSGAAAEDLARLRDKALELGSSTKFSATEAANAMNDMAMAGWKTEDMLGGIEGIMHLATASGKDLASTSDVVTSALTAFGLSASDSGHFADILAVASSNAKTSIGTMGETFKTVAPLAGALGYSADDTALAIGLMTSAGVEASKAGTALGSIFTRLSTDAGASLESLGALGTLTQQLGVEFYNTDGSTRDFMAVLMDSREAWKGLTEEEQLNCAATIAGQDAMTGWLSMMTAAPGDVEKLASSLENADGTAQAMAKTMEDNLASDITKFHSALEGAKILLSDGLTPELRDFVQFGANAISALSSAFTDGGLDGLMNSLGGVITDGLNMVASKIPEVIRVGIQLLEALATGIASNVPALLDTAQEMLASFIGYLQSNLSQLIATGIEALLRFSGGLREGAGELVDSAIILLQTLAGGLIQALPELLTTISEIVSNIACMINENAPKLIATGLELIAKLVAGLIQNIPVILMNMPQIIGAIWNAITNVNWIHLGAILITSIADGIRSMGESLLSTVKEVLQNPLGFMNELFSSLKNMGSQTMQLFSSGISGMASSIFTAVTSIKNTIESILSTLASSALNWGRDMIQGFANGITSGMQNLLNTVKNLAGRIASFLHFSRPDEGPLRDYETWMPDFMAGLAGGIRSNTWRVEDALSSLTSQMQMEMIGAIPADAASAPRAPAAPYGDVYINISGAQYSSEQSLARAIAQELQFMTQRGNAFAPA